MKLISAIKMLIDNRDLFMERLMYYCGSDRQFIKFWFKTKMGYYPDLDNPKTFNEKLQWLKLYYRKPILTTLVDKYAVKKYVADKIGKEYIIPTIGVWNSFDEIDFDSLPNQFVLKCTHDSGGLVICKDKSKLDKEAAKNKIEKSLKTDFYKQGREWPYKNVPRRIIAEQYLEEISSPDTKDLTQYSFFCFDGNPSYCQIIRLGITVETIKFNQSAYPVELGSMIEIASRLSKKTPVSRVDIYSINKGEYYSELTLLKDSCEDIRTSVKNGRDVLYAVDNQYYNRGGYRCILNNGNIQIIPAVGELRDYKFFCFDGTVKWLFVATERQNRDEPYFDFFDMDFKHLDIRHGHPNAPFEVSKPKNFNLMKELAQELSVGFPHVRVDLYEVNGKVYFGEMTFFHHTGRVLFDPIKWDRIFGDEIVLPNR